MAGTFLSLRVPRKRHLVTEASPERQRPRRLHAGPIPLSDSQSANDSHKWSRAFVYLLIIRLSHVERKSSVGRCLLCPFHLSVLGASDHAWQSGCAGNISNLNMYMGGWMHGHMHACMHTWMHGWMDRCMPACAGGCMHGWVHVWMDRCVPACAGGCMHSWMHEWMDRCMPTCMGGCMDA